MLLSKGVAIKSEQQIHQLIACGARYVGPAPDLPLQTDNSAAASPDELPVSFLIIQQLLAQLDDAYCLLDDEKDRLFENKILRIVVDIQGACDQNADAMIGSIQLTFDAPHVIEAPLQNAILCEVCYRRLGKAAIERIPLVAAALTKNIGMREIANEVFHQAEPLTARQKDIIQGHPQRAVKLLEAKNVTDPIWLTAVAQHHERLDGSGYPLGISCDEIAIEAKMLAITDNYTALIRPRAYRKQILHQNALRELMQARGESIDAELVRVFINTIGIYSPGTLVEMSNGVYGIVTRSGANANKPEVLIVTNSRKARLSEFKRIKTAESDYSIESLLCPYDHIKLLKTLGTIWNMRHPLAQKFKYIA